jgi:hypothetical protein
VTFPAYFDGRFVSTTGGHKPRVREISRNENAILVACADCHYLAKFITSKDALGQKRNPLRELIPGGSSHA